MKVLISPILYILLLLIHANVMQATPVAPEVNRLYAAAQQGDMRGVEYILDWHRADDKKKPTTLLQQARALAVDKNDAQAAVVLTTRLKQEQMGSWERYFRGITLAVTGAVILGLTVVGFKTYADKQQALERQVPRDYDIEDINSDGTLYNRHNQRTELAESQASVEREMSDFTGRDRNYPDDSVTGQSDQQRLPDAIARPESKRS